MPVSLVIRGGTVFDGTGAEGRAADVAIDGDRIVGVDDVPDTVDARVIDATGLAVAPGFINVLSHAWASLQLDGSGASELLQGVTTEVMGESFSLGPCDDRFAPLVEEWGDLHGARVVFDHLAEGLGALEASGIAPNVASFIGGANLRILGAGFDDRRLTPDELDRLRGVVAEEMEDGALGIGTALIYPPGRFADTDELVALAEIVGRHGGVYISHMRSEGDRFLECLDELLEIGRRASVATEVYHLKAAGPANHHKMKLAVERIDTARAAGQPVTADMYPYEAGATALAAAIPPQYHVGGPAALAARLADPNERVRMAADIRSESDEFENLFAIGGGGKGILLLADLADGTPATGRWLSDVAADLGMDDVDALLHIVATNPGPGAAYFMMSDDNVTFGLSQPWVSIGSDASAHPIAEPWVSEASHPRTYGTFARFLGHYVRDRGVASFADAIRRMTSLPADTFGLRDRGRLAPGAFADVVVLDPATVADRATYDEPHHYSVGVSHVIVNGDVVVDDGNVTAARPGRHLRRGR